MKIDDVHLSELARSLRALASDSPERQSQIEQLARAYATGNYSIDTEATAAAIIQDSISHAQAVDPRDGAGASPKASCSRIEGEDAALDPI